MALPITRQRVSPAHHIGYFALFLGVRGRSAIEAFGVGPVSATLNEQRKKASELTIVFDGLESPAVFDHPLLKEEVVVTWIFGYPFGDTRQDTYVIKEIEKKYGTTIGMTIKAYDKGIGLGDEVRREVFCNVRASDVALAAAKRLGLAARVRESDVVYETVSLAGMSLGQKLKQLADDEDYDFHIRKGILHFEPTRRTELNVDRFISYSAIPPNDSGRILTMSVKKTALASIAGKCRKTSNTGKDGTKSTAQNDDSGSKAKRVATATSGSTFDHERKTIENVKVPTVSGVNEDFQAQQIRLQANLITFIKTAQRSEAESIQTLLPLKSSNRAEYDKKVAQIKKQTAAVITKAQAQLKDQLATLQVNSRKVALATLQAAQREAIEDSQTALRIRGFGEENYQEEIVFINGRLAATTDRVRSQLELQKQLIADLKRKLDCQKSIQDNTARKEKGYIAARNKARANFVAWKKKTLTATLYGALVIPREKLGIIGVDRDSQGPWLVQTVKTNYTSGDVVVSITANAAPVKKKGKKDPPPKPKKKTKTKKKVENLRQFTVKSGRDSSAFEHESIWKGVK